MAVEIQQRKSTLQGWASFSRREHIPFVNYLYACYGSNKNRHRSRKQRGEVGTSHLPPNDILMICDFCPHYSRILVPDCGCGRTGTLPLGNTVKILLNLNLCLSSSHFKLLMARDHHTGKGVTILAGIIDLIIGKKLDFVCTM